MFNVICLVGWMLGVKVLIVANCSGFWLIVFSLMVLDCMKTPNSPRELLCIPVQFPSKYFPLVLYIFFCLFSGPQLDLGQLINWLQFYYFVILISVLISLCLYLNFHYFDVIACALGVGYIYSQNYMNRFQFSRSYLANAESVGFLKIAALNLSYWVSTVAATGHSGTYFFGKLPYFYCSSYIYLKG